VQFKIRMLMFRLEDWAGPGPPALMAMPLI